MGLSDFLFELMVKLLMAILLRGKTVCTLCGKPIVENQEAVGFPPFVSNELDPLQIFSDGAFHASCFWGHPLAMQAEARDVESREKNPPLTRECWVCRRTIDNPDEYLGLGHLTDDARESIHALNYAQFHRACLPGWTDRGKMCALLEEFMNSGKWKGPKLAQILTELCN